MLSGYSKTLLKEDLFQELDFVMNQVVFQTDYENLKSRKISICKSRYLSQTNSSTTTELSLSWLASDQQPLTVDQFDFLISFCFFQISNFAIKIPN